jgi:CRISPR-associated protein Cas2
MYVLITYDVKTTDLNGSKRLKKVAKICSDYGQRVQNSVFECSLDEGEFALLKFKLGSTINKETDNLRFYKLGKNYKKNIEKMGVDKSYDISGPLIL